MTREESVIILDGFKNNPLFNDTHAQALDMAISALSEKDWKFYYDHGYEQAKRDLSENKSEPIMKLKLDKKYIDEAVQKAVEEIKRNEILIPKGMTNGEVIQALFPQSYFLNDFTFCGSSLEKVYFDDKKSNPSCIMTSEEWWNAPYQKGGEE